MMRTISISRRSLLALAAGTAVPALLGCDAGRSAARNQTTGVPDGLLVAFHDALGLLRGGERHILPHAVTSGGFLFAAEPDGVDTALWRVDLGTGSTTAQVRLPGGWVPRAVSGDGSRVALSPPDGSTGSRPAPRTGTPVLIADPAGIRQRLDLPGNYVPEAFTSDLAALYVLEWRPATAPDRYRVRVVDLATRTPGPLLTRDKRPVPAGAEEEMRGEGRYSVLAPDGNVLYTLYTRRPDHRHTRDLVAGRPGGGYAFIHVLHLVERWAYCVDLPLPFGEGPALGHAMAMSAEGHRIYVVDGASGMIAEVDTETLAVRRTATVPPRPGAASVTVARDRIILGTGRTVRGVDRTGLTVSVEWQSDAEVRGLLATGDGRLVYAGTPNALSWHDPDSWAERGRLDVPGLVGLRGFATAG